MSEELETFEEEEIELTDAEKVEMLTRKVDFLEKENKELKAEFRKKYSIFYPKNKERLISDYPDFKKVREFQNLSSLDLLFVWYYACEGSPFVDMNNNRDKTLECIKESYEKGLPVHKQEKYLAGNFPEKMKIAIARMRAFKIGPRVLANRMMEKIFANWDKISDIDASDDANFMGKDGVDFVKKKAFVEMGKTISGSIGTIISQVEGAFAVSSKEDVESNDLDGMINKFHDTQ